MIAILDSYIPGKQPYTASIPYRVVADGVVVFYSKSEDTARRVYEYVAIQRAGNYDKLELQHVTSTTQS